MVLSERLLKAMKSYWCVECHREIEPGAAYWRLVGWAHSRHEGIQTIRYHPGCYHPAGEEG